jgi:NAD(P)-dependent dehydrogenase (short-subunit alcohol dehydrogenase family)
MKEKVAVVTGGNRGIGLEICRQLSQLNFTVILTSRDEQKGLQAVKELNKQEKAVRHFLLDVTSPTQILALRDFLETEYGRCDVLVNNAGIFLDKEGSFFKTELTTIRSTMETNVYGPVLLCQALVPLMKKNNYGRIINISSGLGQLSDMGGDYTAYRFSKTTINAVTRIVASELSGTNILINSMCPGWVKTDMGGSEAPRSVKEGADTAIFLATLPDNGPTGKIFRDRKEVSW